MYARVALPRAPQQLSASAQRLVGGAGGRRGDLSDAGSQHGNSSQTGGDDNGNPQLGMMPSLKVHGLVGDISKLENRCNWLEERNVWLTQRLLTALKKFIERTVMSNGKAKLQRCFESWREAMCELRLEKQLDEQTRSLDQCQNVAKELGAALTQEQHFRAATEDATRKLQREMQQALEQENSLASQVKTSQRAVELLEQRVREAENCLVRSAAEAQQVIETANDYERQWREIENEHKQPATNRDLVEHSVRLREEAHGVMANVNKLLQGRPRSPELEY